MSLLSGLVFLLIGARLRPGQRFPLLATTRLGVLGVATFFGYLLTTPFLPAGDLGRIATLHGRPGWPKWMPNSTET